MLPQGLGDGKKRKRAVHEEVKHQESGVISEGAYQYPYCIVFHLALQFLKLFQHLSLAFKLVFFSGCVPCSCCVIGHGPSLPALLGVQWAAPTDNKATYFVTLPSDIIQQPFASASTSPLVMKNAHSSDFYLMPDTYTSPLLSC